MQDIQGILAEKTLAVAGLSRDEKSMSAAAYKELKAKGYTLYPVNPNADSIRGEKCYPSLAALPVKVGGVLVFTAPVHTEKVVRDAVAAGIRRIWIQQGAQSEAAVRYCADNGLAAVTKQCILMYLEPVTSIHAFHRWVKKLFGGMPR
ncbi:MAG: CoA-binding protein [Gemmatimonadales bacterium]|nr:MAG: CoA-binding protein [Gemmatimonadales bacterium]